MISNEPTSLDPGVGKIPVKMKDVTIHSTGTKLRGVKALNIESRPWIDAFPVCAALNQYHIVHTGIMTAAAPMRIVRTKQTTTYFLATFAGRGKVLIDGEWRICGRGSGCLLPAHTLNAFSALPGARWQFCWVCYEQPEEQPPLAATASPVLAQYEFLPFHAAITGLVHECEHCSQPGLIQGWVDLIHSYVLRFAQPREQDDRLRLLWERVAENLGDEWNLDRLVREAGYSREHLRRLLPILFGQGSQCIRLRACECGARSNF